jgi:hypothetical protein
MNYAAVNKTTKLVINNIEWDGETYLDPYWTEEHDLIPWDENSKGSPVSPGYTYDEIFLGFIYPKPEQNPSFVFNKITWGWEPPIAYPTDGKQYSWDENTNQWLISQGFTNSQESLSQDNQNLKNIING